MFHRNRQTWSCRQCSSLLVLNSVMHLLDRSHDHRAAKRYTTSMKVIASVLFVLLLLLQGQLWFGSHGVFQLWSLQRTTDELRVHNNELTQRNEQLHAEVQELRLGKEALEERARSHLGFIKDGEVFYRIVPKQENKSP